ncbi:hypothetical protein WJX82_003844 [Trebouxia sp. C0006]
MITAMSPASVISSRVQLSVRSQRRSAPSRNSVLSVRRSVIRRAGEGSSPQDPAGPRGETTEQIRDVKEPNIDQSKTENIQPGNISSENAERRADIGATRPPTLFEAQSFDGPAPETINGRLAMLGVTSALAAELVTGVGLREQWLKAPAPILFSFAIIAIASYIPILKGFTRKEPFENGPFTTKAENWNGRAAMMGFTFLIVTEALSGKSIPQFYGLM